MKISRRFYQQTFRSLKVFGSYDSKWLTSNRTLNISNAELSAVDTIQKHLGLLLLLVNKYILLMMTG